MGFLFRQRRIRHLSLNAFGFIHCSDIHTYHLVAPNFADEKEERILLVINTGKITAPVIWEDLRNCGVNSLIFTAC